MEEIRKIGMEGGAFKVGFADLEEVLPERLKKYRYGISIAFPLLRGIFENVEDRPTHEYFHHYRSMNRLIDDITLKIAMYIERNGHAAYPIAGSQSIPGNYTGVFQHKTVARLSGIGWVGKSAMLITPEHGSRVRFGTVLTDMSLTAETIFQNNNCGTCDECVKACPAGAILGRNWETDFERKDIFNAEKCSNHMKKAYQDIGRGAVCGLCIKACPYSKL